MHNPRPPSIVIQAPGCLDDFALQPNSRFKLESILDLSLPIPANGICGIVLYGLYGTGKTTLANLLPGLIETAKVNPACAAMNAGSIVDTEDPNSDYFACAQGQNGAQLTQSIQNRTTYMSFNSSGLHYIIMDEVDVLTPAAQAGFKSIMNRKDVIFIMTSNNLDQIDKGIQNRSILIDMNVPPINDWRPILRRVYENAGLPAPPDDVLDQVVQAGRGSARSIFSDIVMSVNQEVREKQETHLITLKACS
jgi:replication-associated recombination protein RarA